MEVNEDPTTQEENIAIAPGIKYIIHGNVVGSAIGSGSTVVATPIMQSSFNELDLADALSRLRELGLIELDTISAVHLHPLLGAFVRKIGNEDKALNDTEKMILAEATQVNRAGYPVHLLGWQSHLRHVTDNASRRTSKYAASLCNETGYHLQMIGDYKNALLYYERALNLQEQSVGTDHPDIAGNLNNLGTLLQAMGDLTGARPYLERALAIWEQALGPDDPTTATSLSNLGDLLHSMGDMAGARPYYERALAIREKALGPDHPDTATSLNNLGYLLQAMGNLSVARPYFERALAIREKALGFEHPNTARSLNNLGALLTLMGDISGARPYYERALTINEHILGSDHPYTATSFNNLGYLLQTMGNLEGARPYYERALTIREKALGPNHPDTATSLNNLGTLLQEMRDYAGARPYYERTLEIREQILGSEHPDTAFSLSNLGFLLRVMGNYDEAKPYYERALYILEKALGSDHPDVATILNNLGSLSQTMGNYKEARPYYERALLISEKALGSEHPTTRNIRENLQLSEQTPIFKDKKHQLLEERRMELVEQLQIVYAQMQRVLEETAKIPLQRQADHINEEIELIEEEIRKFSDDQETTIHGDIVSGAKYTINISGSQGVAIGDYANVIQLFPTEESRRKLLDLINRHFSSDELRVLCFELNIDYEDLPELSKSGKVRELVLYMERRNRISDLLEACKTNRPMVSWE